MQHELLNTRRACGNTGAPPIIVFFFTIVHFVKLIHFFGNGTYVKSVSYLPLRIKV